MGHCLGIGRTRPEGPCCLLLPPTAGTAMICYVRQVSDLQSKTHV